MEFTKMQGLGNDYIYINCLNKSRFTDKENFG